VLVGPQSAAVDCSKQAGRRLFRERAIQIHSAHSRCICGERACRDAMTLSLPRRWPVREGPSGERRREVVTGKTLLRQTAQTHSIQASTRVDGARFGGPEPVSDREGTFRDMESAPARRSRSAASIATTPQRVRSAIECGLRERSLNCLPSVSRVTTRAAGQAGGDRRQGRQGSPAGYALLPILASSSCARRTKSRS